MKKADVPWIMIVLLLVIATVVTLASSCSVDTSKSLPSTVDRFIDDEAGVVCWTWNIVNGGGMSCLPIQETRLGQGVING
jgi:hypothetical protein